MINFPIQGITSSSSRLLNYKSQQAVFRRLASKSYHKTFAMGKGILITVSLPLAGDIFVISLYEG